MNYKDYVNKAQEVLKEQYGNDMVRQAKAQEYVHVIASALINLEVLEQLKQPVDYSKAINDGVEKIVQALSTKEKPATNKK